MAEEKLSPAGFEQGAFKPKLLSLTNVTEKGTLCIYVCILSSIEFDPFYIHSYPLWLIQKHAENLW